MGFKLPVISVKFVSLLGLMAFFHGVFQDMTSLPFVYSHSAVASPLFIVINKYHMILVLALCLGSLKF